MRSQVTQRSRVHAATIPIVLAIVATTLATLASRDDRWHAVLDYRRDAIAGGELWRLASAHLMHLDAAHAMLDIVGLLLVAWIFSEALRARDQLVVLAVGVVAVDAGLWFLHPEVDRYVGLSGVLHAWFAAGATHWALSDDERGRAGAKRRWGLVLLVGLVAKLVLERGGSAFWLDGTSMTVVTAAHRWGAAGGFACAVVDAFFGWRGRRTSREGHA